MENWSIEDWQYFWGRDADIPETTFASLYDQDAQDLPDGWLPVPDDYVLITATDSDTDDMFRTAVVSVLDAMFLFNAGIAGWEGE